MDYPFNDKLVVEGTRKDLYKEIGRFKEWKGQIRGKYLNHHVSCHNHIGDDGEPLRLIGYITNLFMHSYTLAFQRNCFNDV